MALDASIDEPIIYSLFHLNIVKKQHAQCYFELIQLFRFIMLKPKDYRRIKIRTNEVKKVKKGQYLSSLGKFDVPPNLTTFCQNCQYISRENTSQGLRVIMFKEEMIKCGSLLHIFSKSRRYHHRTSQERVINMRKGWYIINQFDDIINLAKVHNCNFVIVLVKFCR